MKLGYILCLMGFFASLSMATFRENEEEGGGELVRKQKQSLFKNRTNILTDSRKQKSSFTISIEEDDSNKENIDPRETR